MSEYVLVFNLILCYYFKLIVYFLKKYYIVRQGIHFIKPHDVLKIGLVCKGIFKIVAPFISKNFMFVYVQVVNYLIIQIFINYK